jgi:hypothetical protein
MGSVGDCNNNAMAESFFATLECELLDRRVLENLRPAFLGAGPGATRCCAWLRGGCNLDVAVGGDQSPCFSGMQEPM